MIGQVYFTLYYFTLYSIIYFLPNCRHFGGPLMLYLVDVSLFKKYNLRKNIRESFSLQAELCNVMYGCGNPPLISAESRHALTASSISPSRPRRHRRHRRPLRSRRRKKQVFQYRNNEEFIFIMNFFTFFAKKN
jgi:hypothetical protein